MKLVFILVVVGLVGGWLYRISRKSVADEAVRKSLPDNDNRYRAVSIRPGMHACRAARELVDERFLPDEVPRLPLAGCDAAECTCRFRHHTDRRDEDDRRTPLQHSMAAIKAREKGERRDQDERRDLSDDDQNVL